MGPTIVSRTEQQCRIVVLPGGTLLGVSSRIAGREHIVERITSEDEGHSWSDPTPILRMGEDPERWGLCEALADRDGAVHLFFLRHREGDPYDHAAGEAHKHAARELSLSRCIDIWYSRSGAGLETWETPKCLWRGYTGSLNSVLQLKSGRILLPFSYRVNRRWNNRGRDLEDYTYWGYNRCTLLYSDDFGAGWETAPLALKIPVPDISHAYGAVEPVAVELSDGRVWMLIRGQMGRFYECFSADGLEWTTPTPTRLLSSDSPAGLARLPDGRIVLLWNCCLRFPYAHGGRHVLHGAITADDARTWAGFREVFRDPLNSEPPPTTGDHGTAYPFPTATKEGKILFYSGQGTGRRALSALDPEWLSEVSQVDDFSHGPGDADEWSTFGTDGVRLSSAADPSGMGGLHISNTSNLMPAAAVRNIPMAREGSMDLSMRLNSGTFGAIVILTDHFSTPFDWEDDMHSLFNLRVACGQDPDANVVLAPDQWLRVGLRWDCDRSRCVVSVDESKVCTLPQLKASLGPCYLRLRSVNKTSDPDGFAVGQVSFRKSR